MKPLPQPASLRVLARYDVVWTGAHHGTDADLLTCPQAPRPLVSPVPSSGVTQIASCAAAIEAYLATGEPATAREIRDAIQGDALTVRNTLKRLVILSRVEMVPGARVDAWVKRYRLVTL